MLNFSKTFFESETRDDFFVDSTMKTVWAAELEVLAVVANVCEKYQLPWFAAYGTLLGAVRHQGFIPWDDDIDICMLREDYQKLMAVLPSELPAEWRVYNAMCGTRQEQFWSCVMNSDSVSMEPDRLRQFHGCPFIVGIDIFPLDFIPQNRQDAEMEKSLFELVWNSVQIAKLETPTAENTRMLKSALKVLEANCRVHFNDTESLVSQLWRLGNQICITYGGTEGEYVATYFYYNKDSKYIYEKRWFDEEEYIPFESVYVPVPKGYHDILTKEYGDYMVPIKGMADHNYPFYNDQLEQIRERIRKMEQEASERRE